MPWWFMNHGWLAISECYTWAILIDESDNINTTFYVKLPREKTLKYSKHQSFSPLKYSEP